MKNGFDFTLCLISIRKIQRPAGYIQMTFNSLICLPANESAVLDRGWQGKEEETALAHFALDAYLTTQFLDDVVHDRQPQTVSHMTEAAQRVASCKQACTSLRWDTRPIVPRPEAEHTVRPG